MADDDPRISDDGEERGRPISGQRLMERYGIPHRGSLPRRRGPRGPGDAVRSGSSDGAAPPSDGPRHRRGGPVAAALLAVAVGVIVAVVLLTSGGDDTSTKTSAPAAKPASGSVPRPLTMDFRQLHHGVPGKATISIALLGHGSAHMTIKAAVPNAQYEVSLIKAKGSSKRLLLARDGETTYSNDINLATLARRYVAIEVLALRLPHRPGHGRVRSLRLNTLQLTERLLRNGP